ncbi:hypothetical protein [Hyphomonas oceanitis]|uniref:hypothetical protein n=1 Tax=Hyphomonas oceanitis TaxID=81033 RepID=UPI00300345A7
MVDDYYWDLKKLGVQAFPKKTITYTDHGAVIPNELFDTPGRAIYRRVGTAVDNLDKLHSDEVALNHALNLAFAIASSEVLADILFSHIGMSPSGVVKSVDKDISTYFGWKRNDTITQHDGFYVSADAALGLEVKLGADSHLDQIAKYAFLLRNEEKRAKIKKDLGLLYVVPDSRKGRFIERLLMPPQDMARQIISNAANASKPRLIDRAISEDVDGYGDTIQRMKIEIISWTELHDRTKEVEQSIEALGAGNITLKNLLAGLCQAIRSHEGTEVEEC